MKNDCYNHDEESDNEFFKHVLVRVCPFGTLILFLPTSSSHLPLLKNDTLSIIMELTV